MKQTLTIFVLICSMSCCCPKFVDVVELSNGCTQKIYTDKIEYRCGDWVSIYDRKTGGVRRFNMKYRE